MSTLSEMLAEHTDLSGSAVEHLKRVVGEWQLLADLCFADLLLWVRDAEDEVLCVAQARPTTASTGYPEDGVGRRLRPAEHNQVFRAFSEGSIIRDEDPQWHNGIPVRREAVPVNRGGRVIAVLSRDTNLAQPRVPSPLEIAYLGCAADLCQMIADGNFPDPQSVSDTHSSPRAGDGFIRITPGGTVVYASPNALSAYHRMGLVTELVGTDLASETRALIADTFDAAEAVSTIRAALAGRFPLRVEADARGATVLLRALPLRPLGQAAGAAVLVRDVTDVKRRDRALMSKDATIREIHHRVKNNLQTVAALLRLHARRTGSAEAKEALGESVRRVMSIALVHEALSVSADEHVNLDDVVDRLVPIMAEVATASSAVTVRREGSLGVLPTEKATPLVMVLTELVQNAIQHGFAPGTGGTVVMAAERSARWLDVRVSDDGHGLPAGFSLERSTSLGLQIVRTLVNAELQGSLGLHARSGGGTDAVLRVPLSRQRR